MIIKKSWVLFLFFTQYIFCENTININVKIKGLTYDTIWFGTTYGKSSTTDFFALKQADSSFTLMSNFNYKAGFFAIIYKNSIESKYSFVSIVINNGNNTFKVAFDLNQPMSSILFTGSEENTVYYKYRQEFTGINEEYKRQLDLFRIYDSQEKFRIITNQEQAIKNAQAKFLKNYPDFLVSKLIAKTRFDPPLPGENWSDSKVSRTMYYKNNFLSNFDPSDELFWSSPLGLDWLDHFVFKVCDGNSKSAQFYADAILSKIEKDKKAYKYYFNYMINSYSKMSKYNFDSVYISLVKNHIVNSKADWFNEEEIQIHVSATKKIERLSVGKSAPEIMLYDKMGNTVKLYDIKSKFTAVIFWNPDCGHCKRELPAIKRLVDTKLYPNLNIVTVCTKKRTNIDECWNFINANNMNDWHNLADPNSISNFVSIYDVTSYPYLLILDKDKKIIYRRKGEIPDYELEFIFKSMIK